MMVLNPAPEGVLDGSLRGGLLGLVQSDRKVGCEHIVLVMNVPSVVLLWRKINDLNPVFYKNCNRLFSFTGIYRGHGREKLEHHVVF